MGVVWNIARNKGVVKSYSPAALNIAGQDRSVAGMAQDEVSELVNKLDRVFPEEQNPFAAKVISDSLDDIIDLVRRVKAETNVEFQGMVAKGDALDVDVIRAREFNLIGGSASPEDWLLNHTSTGAFDWLGGSGSGEDHSFYNSDRSGVLFAGVQDGIETPKVRELQFYRFGDAIGPPQVINLRHRMGFGAHDLPAMQFPKPIVMLPRETYNVRGRVSITGLDRLEPIGVRAYIRSDISSL